jgi:transcriptional regulator with AAA-type ATPase domain
VKQNTTLPDSVRRDSGSCGGTTLAIRWVFPSRDGSITRVSPGTTLLGRDSDCGGYLPSASISRRHAEIRWMPGTVPMLRDLDSTNGVFLNGRRVSQAPIRVPDVLRFGDWIGVLTSLSEDVPERWSFQELFKGFWAGPALQSALAPGRLAAPSSLSIILQGATGTGKEGAARAIHAWSKRAGPFVALNCAAIPEGLAESQLFGHQKGAFTDAVRANPGYLRAAQGGTLFLDEVVDLPLSIQAKLLRALEQREVVPLGESKPVSIDVRLVVATQVPLRQAVAENRFRADLLGRLEGLTVKIPPLRERVEEIPFLFSTLIEQSRGQAAASRLDPLLVEHLCTYSWPLNVREMVQLARAIFSLYPEAAVLDRDLLTKLNRAETAIAATPEAPPAPVEEERQALHLTPERVAAVLKKNEGNVKRTAAELKTSRSRIYRVIDKSESLDLTALREGDDKASEGDDD